LANIRDFFQKLTLNFLNGEQYILTEYTIKINLCILYNDIKYMFTFIL